MSMSIDLRGEPIFRPGDQLMGAVRWALDKDAKRLDINLFWFTDGKGTRDVGVVESMTVERPTRLGEKSFVFRLPAAPLSFSGRLITLTWAVEAIAHGTDEVAMAEFRLSRDGQEIRLRHDAPA